MFYFRGVPLRGACNADTRMVALDYMCLAEPLQHLGERVTAHDTQRGGDGTENALAER